jgi:hypothetical protein
LRVVRAGRADGHAAVISFCREPAAVTVDVWSRIRKKTVRGGSLKPSNCLEGEALRRTFNVLGGA